MSTEITKRIVKQLSIECRKTKTKVIILAKQSSEPIKLKVITCSQSEVWENVQLMIGFSFTLDWLRIWHEFFGLNTKRSNAKKANTNYIQYSFKNY